MRGFQATHLVAYRERVEFAENCILHLWCERFTECRHCHEGRIDDALSLANVGAQQPGDSEQQACNLLVTQPVQTAQLQRGLSTLAQKMRL